jgi:hypothetical protein
MERLLETLPTNERRDRLARLGGLHISEFTRENALVRNAALLQELNLLRATSQILGPAAPIKTRPKPCPAFRGAPQEPQRKSLRLAGNVGGEAGGTEEENGAVGEENGEDGGEGEGGGEGGETDEQQADGQDSAGGKENVAEEDQEQAGAKGENENENENEGGKGEKEKERAAGNAEDESESAVSWPKWMSDAHTLLTACPAGGSEDNWVATVRTWVQLEESYGFQSSVSCSGICMEGG